jgi:Flp pilus assembly protein TadG
MTNEQANTGRHVRRLCFLGRLARARKGATAIEFALIATPFFLLLLALFETAMVFFSSINVEYAVNDVGRLIRTGQVQTGNITEDQFRQEVCNRLATIVNCDDRLEIDVRVFSNFDSVDHSSALDEDGNLKTDFQFSPGNAGDIVLVRVFYVWNLITPHLGQSLSNMSGNARLLSASTVFRNEPF